MRTTFVTFRGVKDVAIDYEVDDDSDTNSLTIEWSFGDKDMAEVEATPEEDEAIMARLTEIVSDPHFYDEPDFYEAAP